MSSYMLSTASRLLPSGKSLLLHKTRFPGTKYFSTQLDEYKAGKFPLSTTEKSNDRIAHLKVEETTIPASVAIASALPPGVDPLELIRTGAVYRAPVGMRTDAERILFDVPVYEGEYLRMHLRPRRYNMANIPWSKLVVHNDDDFIVINKPPGMPTVPTEDNYYENVVVALERLVEQEKLYPVQRLDTDTTGVLVIGKTPEFTAYFNQLLRQKKVHKVYKALVAGSLIPDSDLSTEESIVHYTPKDNSIRPRRFTADPSQQAESRLCEMTLLSKKYIGQGTFHEWMDRLDIPREGFPEDEGRKRKLQRGLESYFDVSNGEASLSKELHFAELELEVVSGRTHQIRGQLACIGGEVGGGELHIAGDNMYAGRSSVQGVDKFKSSPYLALQVSECEYVS
jgi:23S rRNA-/tRNA-specific pseudouridylate synthase